MDPNNRPPSNLPDNYLELLAYRRQVVSHSAIPQSPSNLMTAPTPTPNSPAAASPTAGMPPSALSPLTQQRLQQQRLQRLQQHQLQRQQRQLQQQHQASNRGVSASPRSSSNETGDNDNDKKELFPLNLFLCLHEEMFPQVLRWSDDGISFHFNQGDRTMLNALLLHFKLRKLTDWNRQLNIYGFKKIQQGNYAGMMFNQHFHKRMGKADFEAIIRSRKDTEKRGKQKKKEIAGAAAARLKKMNATAGAAARTKKTTAARSTVGAAARTKKTTSAPSKTIPAKGAKKTAKAAKKSKGVTKATKTTKTTKGKNEKKTTSGGKTTSSTSNKKRKKPSDSSDVVDKKQSKKKQAPTDKKGKDKVVDNARASRLKSYRKVMHDYFWKWDMWNYPSGLNSRLENRTLLYPNAKKTPKTIVSDTEPELQYNHSDENVKTLLCDEELPDFVMEERDEKQALADFVDRIRKNNLHREKLEKLWSEAVSPVVKGKTLPQSKFAKPTDKWKRLRVGNRVAIYWKDDDVYYNATIQKQQLKTSYFHLLYEDDSTSEWLDMSREPFKLLDEVKKPTSFAASTPHRSARNRVPNVSDATPQMDNRARSIQGNRGEPDPMNLPESHAHLAPYLRPSWRGLGLGIRAGTPSYNSFVEERDASAPKATAMDILNDLRNIRRWGFSGVPLYIDDEKSSNDSCDDGDDAKALESNQILTEKLRKLHHQISKDNDAHSSTEYFDQTLNAVRKLTDKWSASTVRENLRSLETQVLKLNERESRILRKYEEKGLL